MTRESYEAAKRWSRDHAAQLDASLDEALRQRYADVLNEPIPPRLLQALQRQRGPSAEHEDPALKPRVVRFVRPANY